MKIGGQSGRRGVQLLWLVLLCGLALAPPLLAGPLDRDPGEFASLPELKAGQRQAAQALGEAHRLLEANELATARGRLDAIDGVPALEGYARWVRVRLLMAEGRYREAHALAERPVDRSGSEALRAALDVLKGEALAMAGDPNGAELAWNDVLGRSAAEDEAVRHSVQLSIVQSRQRTGSLDAEIDPRVLLDQSFAEVAVATQEVPVSVLPASVAFSKAEAALEAGHPSHAIELFDRALEAGLAPVDAARARMQRAHALFRARRYEAAANAFEALLPVLEARFWGARSRARMGDVEAALAAFAIVARGEDDELASWALFLAGTLHEDRDETQQAIAAFEAAARFEGVPRRARKALWRRGWAQYRAGDYAAARDAFESLEGRFEEPVERLRPRYWAARSRMEGGDNEGGRAELGRLATGYPLTYYGWRSQERLALEGGMLVRTDPSLSEGTRRIDDVDIERVALLIEADLEDLARDELRFAARRARGYGDRTRLGVLLARVGDFHRANQLVVSAYSDSLARGLQPGREALWWLAWPPAYHDIVEQVFSDGSAVDPELVWAIMREESHYRVDARSAVGALGLLQLMPSTAEQLAREQGLASFEAEHLFDPRTNITLGASYLAQLGRRFDGRMSAAIGSYNAGPRKVASWLKGEGARLDDDVWVESIPYDQTRSYVKRVLRSLHVYRSFYR